MPRVRESQHFACVCVSLSPTLQTRNREEIGEEPAERCVRYGPPRTTNNPPIPNLRPPQPTNHLFLNRIKKTGILSFRSWISRGLVENLFFSFVCTCAISLCTSNTSCLLNEVVLVVVVHISASAGCQSGNPSALGPRRLLARRPLSPTEEASVRIGGTKSVSLSSNLQHQASLSESGIQT